MPRVDDAYSEFLRANGGKSGVGMRQAVRGGVDVDAFRRIRFAGTYEGRLVAKVWSRAGRRRALWCYVASRQGPVRFAVFPKTAAMRSVSAAPLGSRLRAVFTSGASGLRLAEVAEVPDRRRERMCARKKAHACEEEAISAALSSSRTYGVPFKWYRCPYCGKWHVAHADSGHD